MSCLSDPHNTIDIEANFISFLARSHKIRLIPCVAEGSFVELRT